MMLGQSHAPAPTQALCNDIALGQDALNELQHDDSCPSARAQQILQQVHSQLSVAQQQIDAISLALAPLNTTIGKHPAIPVPRRGVSALQLTSVGVLLHTAGHVDAKQMMQQAEAYRELTLAIPMLCALGYVLLEALSMLALCGSGGSKRWGRCCCVRMLAKLLAVAALLSLALSGCAYALVSMVSADFCVDPDSALDSALTSRQLGSAAQYVVAAVPRACARLCSPRSSFSRHQLERLHCDTGTSPFLRCETKIRPRANSTSNFRRWMAPSQCSTAPVLHGRKFAR